MTVVANTHCGCSSKHSLSLSCDDVRCDYSDCCFSFTAACPLFAPSFQPLPQLRNTHQRSLSPRAVSTSHTLTYRLSSRLTPNAGSVVMDPPDAEMADANVVHTDEPSDYAWSINGYAYDSQVPSRLQGILLNCRAPVKDKDSTPFPDNLEPASLEPSAAELATENQLDTGILIGMYIHSMKDKLKTAAKKGVAFADRTGEEPIQHTDQALRVVILIKNERCAPYALAEQDRGICVPRSCTIDQVFFFRQFRDPGDTLKVARLKAKIWSQNVQTAIPRSAAYVAQAKAKAAGPPLLSLPKGDSFAADARRMFVGYTGTGDIAFLEEHASKIRDRLKIVEDNPSQSSVLINRAFNTMTKTDFSQNNIQLLHTEILVR